MSFSKNLIKAEGLSKCYLIYSKPSDRIKQIFFKKYRKFYKEFWALKNVSFEINKNETIGIIGRNGSGKSTLLQLICGTLNPTIGNINVNGRVAGLLELGSGFNPEFSGRENVYMNASLLGLSIKEIDMRYQSILDFADIGEFIDQPVKKYSSGMVMRLAFAVIVHVDADILVVDEALAVGDAVFSQKCMRFIRDFKKKGILIFVSHDLNIIQNICDRVIWLKDGEINAIGRTQEVCQKYLAYSYQDMYGETVKLEKLNTAINFNYHNNSNIFTYESEFSVQDNLSSANGWSTNKAFIDFMSFEDLNGNKLLELKGGENVRLKISGYSKIKMKRPIVGFLFRDKLGQDLFGENTFLATKNNPLCLEKDQRFEAIFDFILPMLPNGDFTIMASIADGNLYKNIQHHWLHDALNVKVYSSNLRYGLIGIPFKNVGLRIINV
jgi:lipopolysaccharide transport system ATP-binding protein